MDSTDPFTGRRELAAKAAKLEREMKTLRERSDEISRELNALRAAIAAYDEVKESRTRSLDAQVQTRLNGGHVTQDAVLAVVGDAPDGMTRGEIIRALGVKGNRSGEVAVDNRLRVLKRDGRIVHEGRVYRTQP